MVITDSGGVPEETTALGVPCLTVRENTERPLTITEGTNTLVGLDPTRLRQEARKVLLGGGKKGRMPALWDGQSAQRIVDVLWENYARDGNSSRRSLWDGSRRTVSGGPIPSCSFAAKSGNLQAPW